MPFACAISFAAAQPYNIFPHDLLNGTIFKKGSLNINCVFRVSLQLLSEIFFILGRTERDMIENIYWSSCKVPVILVRFQWKLHLLERFSKNPQIPNFMKIRSVGADLFHADGRTDMTKLIVACRNFANEPKKPLTEVVNEQSKPREEGLHVLSGRAWSWSSNKTYSMWC